MLAQISVRRIVLWQPALRGGSVLVDAIRVGDRVHQDYGLSAPKLSDIPGKKTLNRNNDY